MTAYRNTIDTLKQSIETKAAIRFSALPGSTVQQLAQQAGELMVNELQLRELENGTFVLHKNSANDHNPTSLIRFRTGETQHTSIHLTTQLIARLARKSADRCPINKHWSIRLSLYICSFWTKPMLVCIRAKRIKGLMVAEASGLPSLEMREENKSSRLSHC